VAALECLMRAGKQFSVGRQTSHVVQIISYLKLFITLLVNLFVKISIF